MRLFLTRHDAVFVRSVLLFSATVLTLQGLETRSWAQTLPTCAPPQPNEHLLLVVRQQADTEEQLRQLLPENAVLTNCQYLNDPVVRVGGFATAEIANAWAQYLADMTGLQAFVARPSTAPSPSPEASTPPTEPASSSNLPSSTQPSVSGETNATVSETTSQPPSVESTSPAFPTPTDISATPEPVPESAPQPAVNAAAPTVDRVGSTEMFNPQPLGAGYAVLVHYFNRPEVAADVKQLTAQPVGLVSYEQRPFLLATHTTDPTVAAALLQALNERGFTAILVDSRRAVLLTPAVVGTEQEG
jgi:hypothetical protein